MGDNMTDTTQEKKSTVVEFKSFKSNPDVENFYRFVYENSLRFEARKLLEHVLHKTKKKRSRRSKTLQ